MRRLRDLYRRFQILQAKRNFRVAVTGAIVIACGVLFGMLLASSYDLESQRRSLIDALIGQNAANRDTHAMSIIQRGVVELNGRTYGGERFRGYLQEIFDAEGNIKNPPALAENLLVDERPAWAPAWMLDHPGTTWLLAVTVTAWLLAIVWLDLLGPFLLTLLGVGIPVGLGWLLDAMRDGLMDIPIARLIVPWFLTSDHVQLFILGAGLLAFTFVLLSRLVMLILSRPWQITAVAHTVVKEAARTHLSLIFIILLIVLLPLLPLWLDREAPLRFQIQSFMSRSLGLTFFLAACMTLFLSCATVAFEIRDRQIWQVMTKPVTRFNYLVGKWVGVVSVNLVLLLVSSLSIFVFIQYLREQPVASGLQGQLDALAIRDEVLTARTAMQPDYEVFAPDQLRMRVDQVIAQTPELAAMPEVPAARQRQIATDLVEMHQLGQRTVPPLRSRRYTFSGLEPARRLNSTLTLRYRFHIMRSDEHETYQAIFQFNEDARLRVQRTYVPTMSHVLPIPPSVIREDGTVTVDVFNAYEPPPDKRGFGALNFEADDFELLYKVGNFEPNFLRAILLNWIKLAFLAMLGIACSTMLSFAVACLLSFTIFIAGAMGPYLAESLAAYYPPPTSQMDWGNIALVIQWAFQWFIKIIAEILVYTLRGFGEYSASKSLVEGRLIPWSAVVGALGKLGIFWSGLALIIGWMVMRSRQLAIYSGHG